MSQDFNPNIPAPNTPAQSEPLRVNYQAVFSNNSGTTQSNFYVDGSTWRDQSTSSLRIAMTDSQVSGTTSMAFGPITPYPADTPPPSYEPGSLWWNTAESALYVAGATKTITGATPDDFYGVGIAHTLAAVTYSVGDITIPAGLTLTEITELSLTVSMLAGQVATARANCTWGGTQTSDSGEYVHFDIGVNGELLGDTGLLGWGLYTSPPILIGLTKPNHAGIAASFSPSVSGVQTVSVYARCDGFAANIISTGTETCARLEVTRG